MRLKLFSKIKFEIKRNLQHEILIIEVHIFITQGISKQQIIIQWQNSKNSVKLTKNVKKILL